MENFKKYFFYFIISSGLILGAILLYKKHKKSSPCESLVTSGNKTIATSEDFSALMGMLEKGESGLQFIPLLPKNEQEKIYLKFVDDYIVSNYLIKQYLDEQKITKSKSFKEEYKQYLQIMNSNFYSSIFQKTVNEFIVITDEMAKEFYDTQKENIPEFMAAPFAKKTPGFEARAVRIDDGKKLSDYKENLKNNKDVIKLDRINASMRGTSQKLIQTLTSMKINEIKEVELENGIKFGIMKIADHKGEWANYSDVTEKVKNVLRVKTLEKKCSEILNSLKDKNNISVNKDCITKIIEKKTKNTDNEKLLDEAVDEVEDEIDAEETAKEEIRAKIKEEIKAENKK